MSTQKHYRIVQPLFSWKRLGLPINVSLNSKEAVQAYDVIYNLLFTPEDMQPTDIKENALAVLEMLGTQIERQISDKIFVLEDDDSKQLCFKGLENV